eukprot:TRINITY_DN37356_c0_g1_i1.p1 TRINITY_DN37356_c0_g1~~TRINITY_DN37356_c0_g1_i1.p1  ORF type:complete len:460 (+),score=105.71 TRINITY_DN37356_c0_g1_i1:110-1489(+)
MVKKRKAPVKSKAKSQGAAPKTTAQRINAMAEEAGDLVSDDEESSRPAVPDEENDEFFETPDEKRVRLAKEYLRTLGDAQPTETIQERLHQDVAEEQRKTRSHVSSVTLGAPRFMHGEYQAPTSIQMSEDERTIWTAGKDCKITRWDVETGEMDRFVGDRNHFSCGGHFQKVLDLCLVPQRDLLVSVGGDRLVRFWDPRCPKEAGCTEALFGHNDTITCVKADPDGNRIYTGSLDKSVKVWDLSTKKCIDTLLGHVTGVSCMDIYMKDRPVTGGEDKTVRIWKVEKDTHLMFSKHTYAVDAVAALDHDRYVSGSQDSNVMVWTSTSKKPQAVASVGKDRWVTSMAAIRGSDTFFSADTGGMLRTWQVGSASSSSTAPAEGGAASSKKAALTVSEISPALSCPGFLNAMVVGKRFIACALAKENRLGRWHYDNSYILDITGGRSQRQEGIYMIPLSCQKA